MVTRWSLTAPAQDVYRCVRKRRYRSGDARATRFCQRTDALLRSPLFVATSPFQFTRSNNTALSWRSYPVERTTALGLWLSVAWGLFVWYIGEGFGGLASGHTLLLMGAPGAALIYVLLALGTMNRRPSSKPHNDKRPAYCLLIVWIVLWTMGSIYQLLPGQNTVGDVSHMISANAGSAPSWMASLDNGVAHKLNSFGTATASMDGMMSMTSDQMAAMPTHQVSGLWFLLLLSTVQLIIGLAVIIPGFIRRSAVVLGCALALTYWIVGQSMGSYFSGLATDPNSGPLFVLLGIAVLGCTQRDDKVRHYFGGIKKALIAELRAFNEG